MYTGIIVAELAVVCAFMMDLVHWFDWKQSIEFILSEAIR